jgi:hypothetical protein
MGEGGGGGGGEDGAEEEEEGEEEREVVQEETVDVGGREMVGCPARAILVGRLESVTATAAATAEGMAVRHGV